MQGQRVQAGAQRARDLRSGPVVAERRGGRGAVAERLRARDRRGRQEALLADGVLTVVLGAQE